VRIRRAVIAGAALLVVVALAVTAGVLLLHDDWTAAGSNVRNDLARCDKAFSDDAKRTCYLTALRKLVEPASNPDGVIQQITDAAWSDPHGFLLPNCHGIMHTVGREYAVAHGVKLATLMDYLPSTNDPSCPAGFSHGLISGVAPQIDPTRPKALTAICARARTRYRRYSCIHGFGHAFMRVYGEQLEPSLKLCKALGPGSASDCAQGVYHDYWFSVSGFDSTRSSSPKPVTNPRRLCAAQPAEFVRPCWYRAFLETRPPGFEARSIDDMDRLCAGLAGLQRSACITGASVIGPADPRVQLEVCAGFSGPDAVSCIHGTKVQNLLKFPASTYVAVIRRCDLFAGATRDDCYRWLGTTLSVITDGKFRTAGCPQLDARSRQDCDEGAAAMNAPLVTFS
jgi:hypothetical protein